MNKADARLERIFNKIKRKAPWASGVVTWLQHPEQRIFRIPLAVLLLFGTCLSFLPGFGVWMLPAGLILVSIDVPYLRHPTTVFVIRGERWISKVWRSIKDYFSE